MRGHRTLSHGGHRRIWQPAAIAMALGAVVLLAAGPASAKKKDETFTPRAAISLPNGQKVQSFDIGYVDSKIGDYLLADRTNSAVDDIDVKNNKVLIQWKADFAGIIGNHFNQAGPNGVITVGHRFLWAGDFGNGHNGGTGGLVKIIDLHTGALVATVPTGGTARADELCNDTADHIVMIANDAEALPSQGGTGPFVSFISTKAPYTVLGKIYMDGGSGAGHGPLATNGIEQCQWSKQTGKFYLNLPEVNGPGDDSVNGEVVVIDPTAMQIVRKFPIPIADCSGPQGMALGPQGEILLGCNDPNKNVPSTVIISQRTGKVIAVVPNQDGADEVWYNPGDGHFFLGNSGGANPQHLGIIDALTANSDKSPMTGTPTGGGAHSVAADSKTNKVFVPIPATAGAGVCSSVGGDDSDGCIAVYKAKPARHEVEGE